MKDIEEGGRVKHRKDGAGTVLRVYATRGTARCRMDSGKETTYSLTRLAPLPASSAGLTNAPTSPTGGGARRKGGSGAGSVDYDLLKRAQEAIATEHPDADHVVPRMYGGRPYCEVWRDGHAWTVFYDEKR